ncbi:general substrate transporter [Tirmania nivea]|nr:general substrate transporter [Tirmania nivea]
MPRISIKRTIITWFLAGIEEEDEERRWITLGEALAEAIIDTLNTRDSEIDVESSSEELSETSISETTSSSSSAPPSWPLIAGDGSFELPEHPPHHRPPHRSDTPNAYVWTLTAIAGISGLLFGYDTGIISSTLLHLSASFSPAPGTELSSLSKSLITSSTSLAALLSSPLSGVLSDRHGRKSAIYLADSLFILGAVWQAVAFSIPHMVIGRFIIGLGVGVGSGVVPMYIAELAPAGYRGRLTTLYTGCITGGQLLAYAVGWWSSEVFTEGVGWRVGVGLGAVPAVLQGVGLVWQPETPRWLVMRERRKEAREVLGRVIGEDEAAGAEGGVGRLLADIEEGVRRAREEEEGGEGWLHRWLDLWQDTQGRRALGVVCMLQGLQQFCGFNSLMYFSATIFSLLNFTNPTATSMLIASTNLLFTLLAFTLIDRIGRRLILLLSIPGMILGLLLSAFAFSNLDLSSSPTTAASNSAFYTTTALLSMLVYVSSYALGIGTVPWTAQTEVFKMQHRGLGNGVATGVNWGGNFVVGITFLGMLERCGGEGVFGVYAIVCAVGWWGVWIWFGERGGRELEEMEVES